MPSWPSSPCTAAAGALRGAPASITATVRRDRASIRAPLRPAAPPPTTTTSYFAFILRTPPEANCGSAPPDRQTLLPIWQTGPHGHRCRPGPSHGRAPTASAAPAAGDHIGRPLRRDRHLGEHVVPAGIGRAAADA